MGEEIGTAIWYGFIGGLSIGAGVVLVGFSVGYFVLRHLRLQRDRDAVVTYDRGLD